MAVQVAREQVAQSIGANAADVVFTSGATESNNLAIKGIADHLRRVGKTHIITTAVEHKSVLEPVAQLRAEGFDVDVLKVKPCGMITADVIEHALNDRTGMVCVQAVNNETGTIQPLSKIADVLAGRNIFLHCDAAQAPGKMPFSVVAAGVDFASFSAHKVHGPQGIGALYLKPENFGLLKPMQGGGGQERGLRSGTLPVALCAGFGTACSLISDDRDYLYKLRMRFLVGVAKLDPVVYGHLEGYGNVPNIINIRFPGIDTETLVMALPGIAIGVGAACSSAGARLSHVIQAITEEEQPAREAIRISFGRHTTQEEIDIAAEHIFAAVVAIREIQQ